MAQNSVRPGRPVRLEMNAQRVTSAIQFYQTLFGWTSRALHAPPWGSIPLIANGERVFGNQFMAMGAFSTPKWLVWFSTDLDTAETRIKDLGGAVGQGTYQLGELGMLLDAHDPDGHPFSLISLFEDPPTNDKCGDPCLAEFWGPNASTQAGFYAKVLGLTATKIETGAALRDRTEPRLFFRDTDFDIQPPRWIPYFRTASVGGDCERARRAGGIVQVHQEVVQHLGELVVMSDPSGAFFGLVDTDKAS